MFTCNQNNSLFHEQIFLEFQNIVNRYYSMDNDLKEQFIKYNDSTLIFRNSFGKTKKYDICELEVVEKSNMCEVRLDGKKIIEWPVLAINLREDV